MKSDAQGAHWLLFIAWLVALFAMLFDDETDDEEKERYHGIANGMADSVLRGMGRPHSLQIKDEEILSSFSI